MIKIRWEDYGAQHDSYEPEENLSTSRNILDAYLTANYLPLKYVDDTSRKRCRR